MGNTLLRRKDIDDDFREAIVISHQCGKGHKVLYRQFRVPHSTERTFKTPAILHWRPHYCKLIPRSDCSLLRQTARSQRASSQTIQVNVEVLNSIIKKLNKYGLFGRIATRKPLLSKKNTIARRRLDLQSCKFYKQNKYNYNLRG